MASVWQEQLSPLFTGAMHSAVLNVAPHVATLAEEIRLRCGKPAVLHYAGREAFLCEKGITAVLEEAIVPDPPSCAQWLQVMGEYSLYARDNELKQGFLHLRGGYRVGLAGRVVLDGNRIERISDISSFNIRISREVIGAANALLPVLMTDSGAVCSTLLISPPQMGKTTMLRDICRLVSMKGKKVCVVDERSEIAGCSEGIARFDIGIRTDVLDACPKAMGMMMAIRTLSPEVIITDELGHQEDFEAVREAARCGVSVIASLHAASYAQLVKNGVASQLDSFTCFVDLGRSHGVGTVEHICKPDEPDIKALPRTAGWRL